MPMLFSRQSMSKGAFMTEFQHQALQQLGVIALTAQIVTGLLVFWVTYTLLRGK